jgi:DNA-binding NtrC family response regulator
MSESSVLILDDETRLAQELSEFLVSIRCKAWIADRPSAAFRLLDSEKIEIALVDIKLPEYDGLEFIRRLKGQKPDIEVIVMSGHGDMDSVINAFRLGAFDYLRKPFTTLDLQASIVRTQKYLVVKESSRRYARICADLNLELSASPDFVGESAGMKGVSQAMSMAASNPDAPLVILGESGTGKELVARRIHGMSARASGRFVAVNCSAVPREIFESEFFGHEKGAFTDAHAPRTGLFRTADGGTLFLDEVGEIPLESQPKLLRVIEEKRVRPVGSDRETEVDVRIICATNRDLSEAAKRGTFRLDLYYRLAVMEIHLPPLRERSEDIPLLARHFLEISGMHAVRVSEILRDGFLEILKSYSYPGNVRELKNFMERSAILGRAPTREESRSWFGRTHGVEHLLSGRDDSASDAGRRSLNLAEQERRLIEIALKESGGVRARAAGLLGLSRQALDRRLERHGISS